MSKNKKMWTFGFIDRNYQDLSPVDYGFEACLPNHTGYGMRPYYMIHYVINGKGKLYCDDGIFDISAGQIFIVKPEEKAQYKADTAEPWEYIWISFVGNLAKKIESLNIRCCNMIYEPWNTIRNLPQRQDAKEEIAVSALFLIFAELFSGKSTRPHYVRRAVDTINSMYMTDLSVEAIASSLGLNRRYLVRLFKANTGMTIQDYIIKVRMEKAEKFLLNGMSVGLTAELVGYSDPFNFSKMFKKYYGVSPSKYNK